jgi:hypothetical protein
MSRTRHAEPDAPLSQERYMSSPEYAELRGISGVAVTAKAALMDHPGKRSLLYFLQAMSLQPGKPGEIGGLQKFSADFLEMFADRIGTPTMHKAGMRPGQKYSVETARKVHFELHQNNDSICEDAELLARKFDLLSIREKYSSKPTEPDTLLADEWRQRCLRGTAELHDFLVDLCVNPRMTFDAPGQTDPPSSPIRARRCWFKDIIGALYEYQRRHAEKARSELVMTEIGKQVFDTLDACLETRKMVIVEGESGVGKTTATEAWCKCHLGDARFVSLSGISQKTGIFRAIAKTLGVACSYAHTATRVQIRVEDILQKSGLMLVVDEAHFALSPSRRVYSPPEIVDWFNTALYNHRVPLGLVCTPQFLIRVNRVEEQMSWNADQLRRRVKRFTRLPAKPTTTDLEAVARKLLPEASAWTIKYLVGYALSSKWHFPAIVDAIDEAKLMVQRDGRKEITFDDLERAILEYCAQSADAWQRQFEPPAGARRKGRARPAPAQANADYNPALSPVETYHV